MRLSENDVKFMQALNEAGLARQVRGSTVARVWEVGLDGQQYGAKFVQRFVDAGYAIRLSSSVFQSPTIGISAAGRAAVLRMRKPAAPRPPRPRRPRKGVWFGGA